MTSKGNVRRKTIIIFGENNNDGKAISFLVAALRHDVSPGDFRPLRNPITLVRNLPTKSLPTRAERVSRLLQAYDKVERPIRWVLMHEDADDVEPAHEAVIAKIESCYKPLPWPVRAVVPAWEIEAWWFLFPEAVRQVRPSWQLLSRYAGRDIGQIRNAKEELQRALKPAGARATFQSYTEADSVLIAERVAAAGQLSPPWFAQSSSWQAFVATIVAL
jgi:hypothetical protein